MREIELIDKRKRREKHFLQEDGTIIAKIYSEDIHYLENGKYEEIDNTLIEEKEYYTNKKNSYKVHFSKKTQKNIMKMENSNHYLDIRLKQEKPVSLIKGIRKSNFVDNLKYQDILNNIDLEYKILPNKVKESIVIKEKNNIPATIDFIVDTDLNLILNNNKSISAIKDSNTYFVIDAPYMVDANGKINKNIHYELVSDVNGYKLTLILDTTWLNRVDIAYPVTIDPTITNQGGKNSVYDTYIYPGDTGIDKNNQDILKAGVERVNGVDTVNRTLIKFDLPEIGTGSQIIDSKLYLFGYIAPANTPDSDIVEIHRITENWNESNANWSNMSNKYDLRIENCFYSKRSFLYVDDSIKANICSVDLTDLVKRWYTDLPNYGIMLRQSVESYKNEYYPAFFSKNNTITGGDPTPILEITYRNQNGLENYMEYLSQEFCNGFSYVNIYNGNLVTVFNILKTGLGKLSASFKLVYNTNDVILKKDKGYGYGYRPNFAQTIEKVLIDEKTYLEYIDEDGTIHYFSDEKITYDQNGRLVITTSDNTFYDEDGLETKIVEEDTKYYLYDNIGNKMEFLKNNTTKLALLNKIIDIDGNSITVIYDSNNRISKIVDSNQNEIVITYGNDIIISNSIDTVTLCYTDGRLTNIVNKLGTVLFTYDDNDLISSIKDLNNKTILYNYYSNTPFRISEVKELGIDNSEGNSLKITYNFASTTVVDNKNRVTTINFNRYGNIESISNLKSNTFVKNAYGKKCMYGESYQNKNKLLSAEIPLQYVKNYMPNPGFEDNDMSFSTSENVTCSISNDYAFSGLKSLKIVNTTSEQYVYRDINLSKGNYYTFSAYIKNTNNIKLALSYTNVDDVVIEKESELISVNSNFNRYDVTIEYPNDAISSLTLKIKLITTGTCYVDDIQLETGQVANNYNYIKNSDFSDGLTGWEVSPNNETSETTTDFEIVDILPDCKALKIKMNPFYGTGIGSKFNISGKKGDNYTISFWYKNEGIIGDSELTYNSTNINFEYEYGQCSIPSLPLNPNPYEWQFFSYTFTAEQDYKSIYLSIFQAFNANNLYITNISLFKNIKHLEHAYNQNGLLKATKGLNNEIMSLMYDTNQQLISLTNPSGNTVHVEYDNNFTDKLISSISSLGISDKVIYNNNGDPIYIQINSKNIKNIVTGIYRIRLKGTNKYIKFENGHLILSEDKETAVFKIESHNILEDVSYTISHPIILNKYIGISNNQIILNDYDVSNSLIEFVANANASYLIKFKNTNSYIKAYNNTLLVSNYIENDSAFEFYIEKVDSNKIIENSIKYTEDGNFIANIENPSLNSTKYNYDNERGLLNFVQNSKGHKIEYYYDNKDRITTIKNGSKNINYIYNSNNMLSSVSQGNKVYNYTYDSFLRPKKVIIGGNEIVTNNYEEKNGNLQSITYGNGNVINFEYDDFDRISKVVKSDYTFDYKYDNNGSLSKIIFGNNEQKFYYEMGRKISKYKYNDIEINYGYDINNNITSKNIKLGNLNDNIIYEYDDDNKITQIITLDNNINYNYDDLGRIINTNINNNYNCNYTYENNGNRTSLQIKNLNTNKFKYSYKYDSLNNLTHIYNDNMLEHKYYYDIYNQLIREDNYIDNYTIRYKYDEYGNLLTKNKYELNSYNLFEKQKYSYGDTNWPDKLTQINDTEILYDNSGNPIKIGNNINLTWKNGRELASFSNENKAIFYKYDNNGNRINKTINGIETTYYYEGNKLIVAKTGNNVLYFIYDIADKLLGFSYNNNKYFYVKNIFEDIIGILNSNYELVVEYIYDSMGRNISIIDANGVDITDVNNIAHINPFRYRSYYYDDETKLYYLKSRYYNPAWGRFLNPDNMLIRNDTMVWNNLFSYCSNNFINFTDSTGHYIALGYEELYDYQYRIVDGENPEEYVVYVTINDINYKAKIDNNVIRFTFSENKKPIYMYTLASALYDAYEDIYSEKMYGRTVEGLKKELELHNVAYIFTGHERTDTADMGTTKNDSNAWISETLKTTTKIIDKRKKQNSSNNKNNKKNGTIDNIIKINPIVSAIFKELSNLINIL